MMEKRFGVIGVGLWGQSHAYVYSHHPGAKLVAVCDANRARAEEIAARDGAEAIYTDYHELLRDPDIDAVSIATPDFAHRDIVLAAAGAGKHILLEKPMATSLHEAEEMAAAIRQAGITFMVDFHNRWNPNFYAAKQSIAAGELGEPQLIYGRLSDTIYVPTHMLSWAARSSVLWFIGSHLVDLACWLNGSRVRRVYCVARSRVLREMGIDTPDFYETVLEFENGTVAVC